MGAHEEHPRTAGCGRSLHSRRNDNFNNSNNNNDNSNNSEIIIMVIILIVTEAPSGPLGDATDEMQGDFSPRSHPHLFAGAGTSTYGHFSY